MKPELATVHRALAYLALYMWGQGWLDRDRPSGKRISLRHAAKGLIVHDRVLTGRRLY